MSSFLILTLIGVVIGSSIKAIMNLNTPVLVPVKKNFEKVAKKKLEKNQVIQPADIQDAIENF
jgi:hypothetical protein